MATNHSVRTICLFVVVSLGCSVDRSGLGRAGGSRDASPESGSEVRAELVRPRADLPSAEVRPDASYVGDVFGEDASSPDILVADLGLAELGTPNLGPDLASEDSRGDVSDLRPEVRRETSRESGPEAAPDTVPPAREAGPETRKCPAECQEGCNVGCGPQGQCVACPTCSCSVESGICHC